MKGAILDKGEKYYSRFNGIFKAIDNEQVKYNWLITNCECYLSDDKMQNLLEQDYAWISGEDFTKLVDKENPQFIWGIFSAFKKSISLVDILKYELPYADGNSNYSQDHVSIQHPLAEMEIGAFDSTYMTFICRDDKFTDAFLEHFSFAKDLDKTNTQDNAVISHIESLLCKELERQKLKATEEILYGKYIIWHKLGEQRRNIAGDEEIQCQILKYLKDIK